MRIEIDLKFSVGTPDELVEEYLGTSEKKEKNTGDMYKEIKRLLDLEDEDIDEFEVRYID